MVAKKEKVGSQKIPKSRLITSSLEIKRTIHGSVGFELSLEPKKGLGLQEITNTDIKVMAEEIKELILDYLDTKSFGSDTIKSLNYIHLNAQSSKIILQSINGKSTTEISDHFSYNTSRTGSDNE